MAVFHDVLALLGFLAILDWALSATGMAFDVKFNLTTISAFLTLVGYSVNDTVVVFDRIRENLKKMAGKPFEEVINRSINQTLSRTIITSGLTWVVVLALFAFGGAALKPFAFVLSVGVIVAWFTPPPMAPFSVPVASRRPETCTSPSPDRMKPWV